MNKPFGSLRMLARNEPPNDTTPSPVLSTTMPCAFKRLTKPSTSATLSRSTAAP
jgi:hypothetical protein